MLKSSQPSTSKASRSPTLLSHVDSNDIEMQDVEDSQDISNLWSIEDDTMFYPQGLQHHSASDVKSVYVAWSENYLLNFVFKTCSKSGTTTLTKVRISMPRHDQELEEIVDILILEMNTLLYMKSGSVYYFSSVKSMHKVDWLTGVRCMNSCPLKQFSVIRLLLNKEEQNQETALSLEVYKDVPQVGKFSSEYVLRHSYDISFDLENIFNCDWLDEMYTLTSLIANETNLEFLKQLISIGDIFRSKNEVIELKINQEVHIFTISGNLFVLVGAFVNENKTESSNPQIEDYSLRLLNTYACSIQCIRINCEKNLLIVLMQSGHMDIWYKSERNFGAIFHHQHQIPLFLDYDYCPIESTFYFTTTEDVLQVKILISYENVNESECKVKETRKAVGGMIACTWVQNFQQLICLSCNNIFYRINFVARFEAEYNLLKNDTNYENLNNLYVLSLKRVKELTAKAAIVKELMEQPKILHQSIEHEFEKQQILALACKSEMFKKLFHCFVEYHVNIPGLEYFDQDCILIKTSTSPQTSYTQSIFSLIFITLNKRHKYLSSVFTSTMWYLHISNLEQSLQLQLPYELINQKLCFIVNIPTTQHECLPNYRLNLLCFVNHNSYFICLRFKLCLATNEKTYLHIFSYNTHSLNIFRNSFNDIQNLLKNQTSITATNSTENISKLKHYYKISKNVFENIIEKLMVKSSSSFGDMDLKLYYLHQYLVVLNYNNTNEILQITSIYPVAIFYLKLLLMHAEQYCNDVNLIEPSSHNLQQLILNYQNDIEHLYGSLESIEVNNITISMHLENLRHVYLKLRNEFHSIFNFCK